MLKLQSIKKLQETGFIRVPHTRIQAAFTFLTYKVKLSREITN
ncbi:hypothetical protein BMS3Abin05_00015 [bacterium BMS3Abin05]|nr:hypothetical protein BMS3Abin05_00015 [bacterium BMS3Abin05]